MKRGAAILMNSDMIQPESPARGWVLAWLNLTPGVAEFWNDVADSLAISGYQLVAAIEHDRAEERTKLRLPHIVGELWSTVGIGLHAAKRTLANPPPKTASIALECMRRDRYFWTDSPINGRLGDLAESGVVAIDALLEPAVNRRPPAAVIVWNCSGSSSHAVAELARPARRFRVLRRTRTDHAVHLPRPSRHQRPLRTRQMQTLDRTLEILHRYAGRCR